MKSLATFCLCGIAASLFDTELARAELTKISGPVAPVFVSAFREYTAEDDNTFPILNYKWEMKCTMPNAVNGAYATLVEGAGISTTYISVTHYDEHKIRCTATYGDIAGDPGIPAPQPTSKEFIVNVVKPNKSSILPTSDVSDRSSAVLDFSVTH